MRDYGPCPCLQAVGSTGVKIPAAGDMISISVCIGRAPRGLHGHIHVAMFTVPDFCTFVECPAPILERKHAYFASFSFAHCNMN